MADLTDEYVAQIAGSGYANAEQCESLAIEVQRHRRSVAADANRIRSSVRACAIEALENLDLEGDIRPIADAIAEDSANHLAASTVYPITDSEASGLWMIRTGNVTSIANAEEADLWIDRVLEANRSSK